MLRIGQRAVDAAERDVMIGVGTGIVMTLMRAGPAVALVVGGAPLHAVFFPLLCIQAVLSGLLTYGVYRRRSNAAVGLLALWAFSFILIWVQSGWPPIRLVWLLLTYGAYRGFRGTRALERLRVRSPAPAV